MRKCLFVLMIFFLAANLTGQEIPAGGESVLAPNAALQMNLYGNKAQKTLVDIENMPFERAAQGQTLVECSQIWDAQFSLKVNTDVSKDDVLLAVFWAKGIESSDETGEVYSEFVFERDSDPYTKSVSHPIVVVGEWKQFFVPFECAEDYTANQAGIKFRLGYKPQIIQIGGLEIYNYQNQYTMEDLPRTTISYAGMEADAAWRQRAEEMIDLYRKGDIEVIVNDANGQPVQDAAVKINMQKHAYKFGSAVAASQIMGSGSDSEQYNQIIQTYFNRVVMENDLKWGRWESDQQGQTFDALDWLMARDIEIRGHCLVWPSWRNTPDDLEENKEDPDYIRSRIIEHIEDEVGELCGIPVDWDVVNENYWNHDIMDILGDEVMVDWFNLAHVIDPNAKLYLNDNNIISAGGLDEIHQDFYMNTIQMLLDNDAPIHGIGTQCHFGSTPTPPERIWSILDKLAEFDLEIQATEFDISSDDAELKVNYTRDFMTAYFAHPATVGILMWGFWEGRHWRPDAALWDNNWNLMPHGETWIELVTETWWTDAELISDGSGVASTRGFLGDYAIEISYDGTIIEAGIAHGTTKTTVTVTGTNVEVEHGAPTYIDIHQTDHTMDFHLDVNYPNPFNPETVIPYTAKHAGPVRMAIYNSNGQLVKTLIDKHHPAGRHTVLWDGTNDLHAPVTSGVYLVKMEAGRFARYRKLTLLR